jgi:hypothetical protein
MQGYDNAGSRAYSYYMLILNNNNIIQLVNTTYDQIISIYVFLLL